MTRKRKGRRPEDPRDADDRSGQPRVGPDGRPDERSHQPNAYTPPPSPLTRWQHHGRGPQGAPRPRARGAETGRMQYGPGARPGAQQQNAADGNRARWTPPDARTTGGNRARWMPPDTRTPAGNRGRWTPPETRTAGGERGRPTGGERGRWTPPGGGNPRYERRGGQPPATRPQRRFDADRQPRTDASRATPPGAPPATSSGKIDAFDLFCAYHLGITPEGSYRIQNIHEVARRFGTNAADLRQTLTDLGMAADDIVHSGFDLPSAQVDIMVAPEGISRRELARPLYDEFRTAPKKTRDWAREMEDAQRQIDETIGRDGRWSPAPRDPAGKQS